MHCHFCEREAIKKAETTQKEGQNASRAQSGNSSIGGGRSKDKWCSKEKQLSCIRLGGAPGLRDKLSGALEDFRAFLVFLAVPIRFQA